MYRLEEADITRFWSRVDMLRHPGGCWPRGRNKYYAHFYKGPQSWWAHRVAYELTYGPTDDAVDHTCHNPPCCNPAHLRPVTVKQNAENRAGPQRNTTSGIRGVTWDKVNKRWRAQVKHRGKNYVVGRFTDKAAAEAAVIAKRNELFTHNDRDR